MEKRLDILIMEKYGISRTQAARLVKEHKVNLSGQELKPATILSEEEFEKISVKLPETKPTSTAAENIPLPIIYSDPDLLIVHKPAGMVVHPACNNYSGTMVNALLYHCHDLSDIGGIKRPGIVHRLDKDTEGLLVVAKNNKTHQDLSKQFEKHSITRRYLALVQGNVMQDEGTISGNLARSSQDRKKVVVTTQGGKNAVTHYKVLKRFNSMTLVDIALETGRTHQIRVHFAYLGHPLIGDIVYNPEYKNKNTGLKLIAYKLGFIHPTTKKYIEFSAELPKWAKK
jgi:23S rRNA pseudouridine1911/1915/1917 synthase